MPDITDAKGMCSLTDKSKASQRDLTLINILERMVGQLQRHDALLQDAIDSQTAISSAIENSVFHQNLNRDEMEADFKKLQDSFARYRTDMLSLVREQDIMRRSVEDMLTQVSKLAYSFENTGKTVADIDARLKQQDKTVHDHVEYSSKKWEKLPSSFSETNRNIAELHTDVKKNLDKIHDEMNRQLEKYQRETTRRLLTLDGMMSALETLLIRTEPPEKKPSLPMRVIKVIAGFFRSIGRLARRIGRWIVNKRFF